MTLERFRSERKATWDQLERLVRRAGSRPAALGGDEIRRLGSLYRSTAADLAQIRQRFPHDPIAVELDELVRRAQALVYGRASRDGRLTFREFFATEYWRTLMERPGLLLLAALMLVGPGVTGLVLALSDPVTTAALVPGDFLWVAESRQASTDIGADAEGLAAFSTAVLVNNIQVTVLAFALGITFGIGTGLVTAYNGFILGAVVGLGAEADNGALLVEAVAAHGILELSCVVVAALAGLRLASGLVSPGLRPRRIALREESVAAVKLVVGTAPWLVLAGFVEGFVSRTGTTAGPAVVTGVLLGGAYWWLAAARGTGPPEPGQNRARDLARR